MCVDNDSRPPITPIAGGSAGSVDLRLELRRRHQVHGLRGARGQADAAPGWSSSPTSAGCTSTTRTWPTASPRSAWTPWPSTSSPARRPPTIAATSSSSCRTWDRRSRKRCRPTSPPRPSYLRGKEGGQVRSLFSVGFCFGGALSYLQAASGLDYAGVIGFYGWPLGLKRWPDRPKPIDAVQPLQVAGAVALRRRRRGHPAGRCRRVRQRLQEGLGQARRHRVSRRARTASSTASSRNSPTPPPMRGSARRPS